MLSHRWSCFVGVGALTLLLGVPSLAKSCPRRGLFARGGYSYPAYSPVGFANSGSAETRASQNDPDRPAAGSTGRVIPAAAVMTANSPLPPPRVAPLSEQTGNDNFGNSGQ